MKAIETIGLPGSGKSTINKLLLDNNKIFVETTESYILKSYFKKSILLSIINSSKVKKIFINQYYFKNSNKLLSEYMLESNDLLSFVLKSNYYMSQSKTDKVFVLKWMLRLIVDFQQSKLAGNKFIIFDEGFMHKTISLFVNPNQENFIDNDLFYLEINKYLELVPVPSKLIFVDISINSAFERLKKRGFTQRTKKINESKILEYLSFCDKVIRYVVNFIKLKGCQVIVINNNQGLENLKQEMYNKISFKK